MNTKTCKIPVIVSLLLAGLGLSVAGAQEGRGASQPNTGMADAAAFINLFDRFLARLPSLGGGRFVNLSLVGMRGLTSESFNAGGQVRVDLTNGAVVSQVAGLAGDGRFELWLADNRPSPGHSTLADRGDLLIRVGVYQFASGMHTLSATLGADRFKGFAIDRAFVTRAGQSLPDVFVLTGATSVFDRLFRRQVRFVDEPGASLGFDPPRRTRGLPTSPGWSRKAGGFLSKRLSTATAGPAPPATSRATTSPSIRNSSPRCRRMIRCLWPRPIPRWP